MKKFIMSVDQGTTSSRVVLYNLNFQVVDIVQKEFRQYFPNEGWVEHDPLKIWKDIKSLIKKSLKKNNISHLNIISIGITNQRETTVLWNKKNGKPVYNAIVWQDRRTAKYCNKIKNTRFDKKIQKITGLIIDPYFSATKIKWIIENIASAKKALKEKNLLFGTIDTWLLWNLTEKNSHLTDITNASRTMIFDPKKETWSDELVKFFKIPKNILPEVVENAYDFGFTTLFGGKILIGGMAGDQQAATIGQACFKVGQAKSTYGTGCFLLMNIGNSFQLSSNKLLTTVAYKIKGKKMYCYEGSIFVAGSAIQWLRDKLFFFSDSEDTNTLYVKANKEEKVMVVPALTGLGAPHWNPDIRGAIFGLSRNTSIADIVKATLDSLSLQTLDLLTSMQKDSKIKLKEIRVDGGMINNNNFIQSLSNINQIKIIKPNNIETTSLGVAYLAAIQSGVIKNFSEINNLWKARKIYKPKISKKIISYKINKWKEIIKLLSSLTI
ncbi:MAG: glycerol kinase [Rickettsiales bacterium]|nr:glycerol kinase [Rickettsiales bacterium]